MSKNVMDKWTIFLHWYDLRALVAEKTLDHSQRGNPFWYPRTALRSWASSFQSLGISTS